MKKSNIDKLKSAATKANEAMREAKVLIVALSDGNMAGSVGRVLNELQDAIDILDTWGCHP